MDSPAYFRHVPAPASVHPALEALLAARGQASKVRAVIDESPVPMVLVDNERRYLDANRPARLLFRLSLAEMRGLRIDDLVPPDALPSMIATWNRMLAAGSVLGVRELLGPVGERLRVARYALANVLPGQHIGILAPVGWPVEELGATCDTATMPHAGQLTPREREVLQLAAEGLSTPAIAERLTLSPSTVTTHFNNVYVKLDVPRRSAAVAKALRLGFIE